MAEEEFEPPSKPCDQGRTVGDSGDSQQQSLPSTRLPRSPCDLISRMVNPNQIVDYHADTR